MNHEHDWQVATKEVNEDGTVVTMYECKCGMYKSDHESFTSKITKGKL